MADKPDETWHQQSLLPLSESAEADRIALVRGALARFQLQARVAEDLERLIHYLDRYDTERTGCRARIDTLAAHLRRPARTVQRRLAELRSMEIVETFPREGLPVNRVRWERLRGLAFGTSQPVADPTAAAGEKPWPPAPEPPQKSGAGLRQSGACGRQSGAGMRHSGVPIRELKPFSTSNPSPSLLGAPVLVGDWGEVLKNLREAGMGRAAEAVAAAREHGLSAADVHALWQHWHAMRPAWGIGGLFYVLNHASAGTEPQAAPWPAPDKAWQSQQQRAATERQLRNQAAQREASDQQLAADAARRAELEAVHGAALDKLPESDYRGLVEQHAPTLLPLYRASGRDSPLIREALLAAVSVSSSGVLLCPP